MSSAKDMKKLSLLLFANNLVLKKLLKKVIEKAALHGRHSSSAL
jgi:hypothetical protein